MTSAVLPARPALRWILPEPVDQEAVRAIADELHLPAVIATLLLRRGQRDGEAAKRYLRPRLDHLHDPSGFAGMDRAVERLIRAIRERETILVHGDYDVDGMCSTTLLTRAFRYAGAVVVPFIPKRLVDGYDLSEAGVRAAKDANARVVVTADCGTSALASVQALCRDGIDVIVTDHHLPGGPLPDCLAVLNPRSPACGYPDKDLCAAGVAFKLALALVRTLGLNENPVLGMLDLVALATIADIAPLRGENRALARYGLRLLAESRNHGLRALIRSAGLDGKTLTASRVSFVLAPRLNAVGRLGHALRGVDLLLAESEQEANRIARELEELNRERQEMDRATLDQARGQLAGVDFDATYGLVLADERWHPGVIGIVASRVVEETGRPVVMIALEGEIGRGSGRSIPAFDLHGALGECRDLLLRFGGHRAAAGVTVRKEMVAALSERFNAVARERLTPEDLIPQLRIDLEVKLDDCTESLEALLRHFEPFGVGNPAPVFLARGVRLAGPPRVVGKDHLKLQLDSDCGSIDAIGWGMAPRASALSVGQIVDVAFRLERDEYQGESRLQAKLADLRA